MRIGWKISPQEKRDLRGWILDVPSGVLDLYWKGKILESIRKAAKKAPKNVRVDIHPAKKPPKELRLNSDRIVRKWGLSAGGPVHRVTPLHDGSGLEVGLIASPTPAASQEVSNDPWVAKTEVEEKPSLYSGRWGGESPFEGGIEINGCSAAFGGVKVDANGSIADKPVTAAHCFLGPAGGAVYTGNANTGRVYVGRVEEINRTLDSVIIAIDPASSYAWRMWDGGVRDGTEYTKPVAGTAAPRSGAYVCTSGAWSGVHCDIKITKTGTTLDWGTHVSTRVAIADQIHGQIAAGSGDSGGPVFMLTSNFSQVLATGVVIGGDTHRSTSCTYLSTRCSSRLYFTDFRAVKEYWKLYTYLDHPIDDLNIANQALWATSGGGSPGGGLLLIFL
ncbi:S1 family peptidase [Streptomyces chryseus]